MTSQFELMIKSDTPGGQNPGVLAGDLQSGLLSGPATVDSAFALKGQESKTFAANAAGATPGGLAE